jgi:hypothetical protein
MRLCSLEADPLRGWRRPPLPAARGGYHRVERTRRSSRRGGGMLGGSKHNDLLFSFSSATLGGLVSGPPPLPPRGDLVGGRQAPRPALDPVEGREARRPALSLQEAALAGPCSAAGALEEGRRRAWTRGSRGGGGSCRRAWNSLDLRLRDPRSAARPPSRPTTCALGTGGGEAEMASETEELGLDSGGASCGGCTGEAEEARECS